MAKYSLEITRTAEKQLKRLPGEAQKSIVKEILALSEDPLPKGCRKLSGYRDVFRIRIGKYRVIYSLGDEKLIVIILKVGHRRDIYR